MNRYLQTYLQILLVVFPCSLFCQTSNRPIYKAAAINNTRSSEPKMAPGTANSKPLRLTASDSIVINDYTPVTSLDNKCKNMMLVADGSAFHAGDTVLIIQMKGVITQTANTAQYGDITDYRNAGNYEFNYIKSVTGNSIELLNKLERTYDFSDGKVQLIRVPYYDDYVVVKPLTCLPWDGVKGGVLVLNVKNTLTLQANIDVSGRGFRGGIPISNAVLTCNTDLYVTTMQDGLLGGEKGESIVTQTALLYGRGKLANGGGGGNAVNAGGAGGGNGGDGGTGGKQYVGALCHPNFLNGGIGGIMLDYNNALNKIFLGGGGGAGQDNEHLTTTGGFGGGIAIIRTSSLVPSTNKIAANGGTPANIIGANEDGRSGGGAGGTILLEYGTITGTATIETKGGNGDNSHANPVVNRHGPGGGGGGGVIWINKPGVPANISGSVIGGAAGVNLSIGNDPWGASSGIGGKIITGLVLPVDNVLFKTNIDSVRFNETITNCNRFDFSGLGYVNTNPVASWAWNFGDGNIAAIQNPTHTYAAPGNHKVTLVITDINGCKDSIIRDVAASLVEVEGGADTTICSGTPYVLTGSSAGGVTFSWTPPGLLNDPTILGPTANLTDTTKFYITATSAQGCSARDSVMINVRRAGVFAVNAPAPECEGVPVQLTASGGDLYHWQPITFLNDPLISNPLVTTSSSTNYTVSITDTVCHLSKDLPVLVSINTKPTLTITKSNDIDCNTPSATLQVSGATDYSWSPLAGTVNSNSANPTVSPTSDTWYVVNGKDLNGCTSKDSVFVEVKYDPDGGKFFIPSGFTPNNDGKNDCFGVRHWGTTDNFELSVYDRWGVRVFVTKNNNDCWNGIYKGEHQPAAVYVYQIKAISPCSGSQIYKKGFITLIR